MISADSSELRPLESGRHLEFEYEIRILGLKTEPGERPNLLAATWAPASGGQLSGAINWPADSYPLKLATLRPPVPHQAAHFNMSPARRRRPLPPAWLCPSPAEPYRWSSEVDTRDSVFILQADIGQQDNVHSALDSAARRQSKYYQNISFGRHIGQAVVAASSYITRRAARLKSPPRARLFLLLQ